MFADLLQIKNTGDAHPFVDMRGGCEFWLDIGGWRLEVGGD